MKIKKIVTVLLISFILASCAQATTYIPPTKPFVPPLTIPVLSPTSAPTKIPTPPTETQPSNVDFLAHTENVFPLVENEKGFVKYVGMMDLGNPSYEKFTAPDGITKIMVSFIFTDGDVEFLLPELWVHRGISYSSLTLLPDGNPDEDAEIPLSDLYIKRATENTIAFHMSASEGQPNIKVTLILDTGLNPDALTPMFGLINPFPVIWENTNWDEAVRMFMQTGDPNDLPKINGVPVLPAVSIRHTGSVPFFDE